MTARSAGILWFKNATNDDAFTAGVFGVKLGEMQQAGFPVPNGFIVTSLTYFQFIKFNNLITKISPLLQTINFEQPDSVMQVAAHIQKIIMNAPIPEETVAAISQSYNLLSGVLKNSPVTLTFSPTGGKQQLHTHTLTNVHGESNLLLKIKQAWLTLFVPQALIERHTKHIDHFSAGIAVTVQQEITATTQGVMMTTDPVGTNKNHLIIEASGTDGTLDHYAIDKTARRYDVREQHLENEELKLSEEQLRELTDLGKKLEKFLYFPQEVSWAIQNNSVFLLSTKPLQVHETQEEPSAIATKLPLILKAIPGSRGITSGITKLIQKQKDITKINHGEILLFLQPLSLPQHILKKAAGLIVIQNSRVSPLILMAREYGIPAVIAQRSAQEIIKPNMIVTIDGTKGWIYKGSHTQHVHNQTATKIFATLNNLNQNNESLEDIDGVLFEPDESFLNQPVDSEEHLLSLSHTLYTRPLMYHMADKKDETYQLLGLRGSTRSLQHPDLLHKELTLLQQIKKHTTNLSIMLPFIRNVSELVAMKNHLADYGLSRSATCKLWISIETPSNVHLLEEFIRIGIDGISIDSDTLTMLYVGTDKDNSEIAHAYDALDPSVLSAFEQVIKTAHRHGISSSIHGHTILHHRSLIEKLVAWGVTNISVPPSEIDQIKNNIREAERSLIMYKV